MSTRPDLPFTVAEFPKNDRGEVVRVILDEYRGHKIFAIRVFYTDASGDLQPGKNGIGMAVKHLPVLADAINAALAQARAGGLVPPGVE